MLILISSNYYLSIVQTWSCQLEISAQKWADQCIFRHSSRKQREGIGENLYAYWSSANVEKFRDIAGTDAGKSWWSELPQLYTDNPSNILTPEVYSQGVSHFTQVNKISCENN
ncbi:unnamed protein product [Brugia timori]|uniref:SCP domain-containing protein n=1 Tax=Brugia timori TaxID=42155 RepID=A0A0R3RA05_9BILA|nr:unnamed protein product [Brugia timori]